MEENKKKKTPSYDELKKAYDSLVKQTGSIYTELQRANLSNVFKRLDFLFTVVKYKDAFKEDFVNKCIDEIVETMTLPEEEKTTE